MADERPGGNTIPDLEQGEFFEDLQWGEQHYSQLQRDFADQWVALVGKKVAAAGKILKEVEERAAKLTRRPVSQIPLLFIESGAHVY